MFRSIKPLIIWILTILLLLLIFRLLFYAIPIIFIIWILFYVYNKIKKSVTFPLFKKKDRLTKEHLDLSKTQDFQNKKVVDVDYEEIKK